MAERAEGEVTEDPAGNPATYQWAEFLSSVPPGTQGRIPDLVSGQEFPSDKVSIPELLLHCSSDACRGERIFAATEKQSVVIGRESRIYLVYLCRNCRRTQKSYALLVQPDRENKKSGAAIKIGEWPPFGPPTPARVISMVGPDRDLFLKGRRAENQALGVGAFAYYRRVVENQRGRLFSEIKRVAVRLGARPEVIAALDAAAKEQQFSKSIDMTKDAIPNALLIDGHNPLVLLHRALSVGIHDLTDDDCLERARAIRVVLAELAERIGQVLKDTAELKEAIAHLLGVERPPRGNEADRAG